MAYGLGPTNSAVALTLPTPQLGSDPDGYTRDHGEIVHERYGLVVGARTWARVRRFRLVYAAIPEATVWSIRSQLSYRTLYYYTDTGSLTSVHVKVADGTFSPSYVGPGPGGTGIWACSFELQEIVS